MTQETEIPEDVLAVAKREAEFFTEWLRHGNSTGSLSPHAVDGLADSIARAILAERARCAKEAVKQVQLIDDDGQVLRGLRYRHAVEIEAAIRSGANP